VTSIADERFAFTGLTRASVAKFYNAFDWFDWHEPIGDDVYWMSPELVSLYGTEAWDRLSEPQRHALSKWEFINFCSVNMHGEKSLVTAVLARLHTAAFANPTEYFHHFVDEENKHMWMFSRFCLSYGKKIYPDKTIRHNALVNPLTDDFLAFAKITIFEEIGDYYNRAMRHDERLPHNIRKLNDVHHLDESRHLSMGHSLLALLYEQMKPRVDEATLRAIERYLKEYMTSGMAGFYNVAAYRDAGVADPFHLRRWAFEHPRRRELHRTILGRIIGLFIKKGIFRDDTLYPGAQLSHG
jgi:hypothetical protein